MQWMTVTSLVPCHALHVPQHVAVSLSEPLNQVISSAPSTETVFAYLDYPYQNKVQNRHNFWVQNRHKIGIPILYKIGPLTETGPN